MKSSTRLGVLFGLILLAVSLCLLAYTFWPLERSTDTQPLEPLQIPWILTDGLPG